MSKTVKIAVVGSRGFDDYELFESVMNRFLSKFERVSFISGGAGGADRMAERYAKEHSIEITIYKPEWKRYGRGAGYVRNKLIWEESDFGIAFWDGESKGTRHSFKLATKMSKELFVYDYVENRFISVEDYRN